MLFYYSYSSSYYYYNTLTSWCDTMQRSLKKIETSKVLDYITLLWAFIQFEQVKVRNQTFSGRWSPSLPAVLSKRGSSEAFTHLGHIQATPDPSAMSLSVTPAAERGQEFRIYCKITGQSWWKSVLKAVWVHQKEAGTSPLFLLPSPSSPFRASLFNLLISTVKQQNYQN